MPKINLRLTDGEHHDLVAAAAEDGISLQKEIMRLVRESLENRRSPRRRRKPAARFLHRPEDCYAYPD